MTNRRDRVNKEIKERDEGKDFRVPEWAAFLVVLATVNKMPNTIPVFVGFPLIMGFVKGWSFALDVAILEICGLTLTTFMAIGILIRDGSFRNYLAMGFTENPIGKYLKSKFGEEV